MAAVQQQLAKAAPAEKLYEQLKAGNFIKHDGDVVHFKKDQLQNLPQE